ncbi:MAG: hypothetical protein UT26_C0060G0005 [Microgenomates group bacterium GW2011_GWC1_39_12]|nr:MAG: hypothetical protein UT26_C0060G0005 [Microgenomates group bacterium GW2011_GWC1_39_12]
MVRRLVILFVFIFIVVSITVWWRTPGVPIRNSIVFIGEPTVIVSWDTKRSQYVILTIPSDIRLEALHGYGSYSIASLWKLDMLEKRHGSLFLPSLSVVVRSSSLTLIDMVRVWLATRAIDASSTGIFDFRSRLIGTEMSFPDGSRAVQFDQKTYDGIVGDIFGSVEIRKDAIRLAIYNTTSMLGIGSRVARVIEQLGGYIVFVGNDDVLYDGLCELTGTKERLISTTSKVIQSLYGCTDVETSEILRGDLILRLGKLFEKRYLPY